VLTPVVFVRRRILIASGLRSHEGKMECSVGPGEVFAAGDMEGWGCNKGFFVLISCGGNDMRRDSRVREFECCRALCRPSEILGERAIRQRFSQM
jgi:hypothetical protein